MEKFPKDVLSEIFSYLGMEDSVKILSVCKSLKRVIMEDESRWKNHCLEYWENTQRHVRMDFSVERLEYIHAESGNS